MSFNSKPKYPSRRAYVLKLRSDAKPGAIAGLEMRKVDSVSYLIGSNFL